MDPTFLFVSPMYPPYCVFALYTHPWGPCSCRRRDTTTHTTPSTPQCLPWLRGRQLLPGPPDKQLQLHKMPRQLAAKQIWVVFLPRWDVRYNNLHKRAGMYRLPQGIVLPRGQLHRSPDSETEEL